MKMSIVVLETCRGIQ